MHHLDLVIGAVVNGAFVVVVFQHLAVQQEVQFHAFNVAQGQFAHVVVQHVKLFFRGQRFVQRILDDVKQGGVVLGAGADFIPRVLQRPGVQLEVCRDHLDHFRGGLVFIHVSVLVFQVAELIIGGYVNGLFFGALFGEHKAVKHIGAVHGQLDGIALGKVQRFVFHHRKRQLAG